MVPTVGLHVRLKHVDGLEESMPVLVSVG